MGAGGVAEGDIDGVAEETAEEEKEAGDAGGAFGLGELAEDLRDEPAERAEGGGLELLIGGEQLHAAGEVLTEALVDVVLDNLLGAAFQGGGADADEAAGLFPGGLGQGGGTVGGAGQQIRDGLQAGGGGGEAHCPVMGGEGGAVVGGGIADAGDAFRAADEPPGKEFLGAQNLTGGVAEADHGAIGQGDAHGLPGPGELEFLFPGGEPASDFRGEVPEGFPADGGEHEGEVLQHIAAALPPLGEEGPGVAGGDGFLDGIEPGEDPEDAGELIDDGTDGGQDGGLVLIEDEVIPTGGGGDGVHGGGELAFQGFAHHAEVDGVALGIAGLDGVPEFPELRGVGGGEAIQLEGMGEGGEEGVLIEHAELFGPEQGVEEFSEFFAVGGGFGLAGEGVEETLDLPAAGGGGFIGDEFGDFGGGSGEFFLGDGGEEFCQGGGELVRIEA